MEQEFVKALPILHHLMKAGHQAYFVGGAVRDSYMKRKIGDVDIATSALPNEVERLFKRTVDVGKEHGTVIVLWEDETYEVTTFRAESEYKDYRRPEAVRFITSLSEDLKRRDLTINAMAMSAEGELLDYFGGAHDIGQKLIRTVGNPEDRFREDALRMMRAVRFMSQLGFLLEKDTREAVIKDRELMAHVSVERKTVEFEKLMQGAFSQEAIQTMVQTGLIQELPGLSGYEQQMLEASGFPFSSLDAREERWAALLLFLGLCPKSAEAFLKQWKLPGKVIKKAVQIISVYPAQLEAEAMYRAGEALFSAVKIEMLKKHRTIDEQKLKEVQNLYEQLPIKSLRDLDISGADLMELRNRRAGKWVAEELRRIEEAVVAGKLPNRKHDIKEWLASWDQH
ncbi:CCA tRNA nucleotidyltransferase [Bacillus velezensis]|uniref:CCA tRNA nucleotidyltransferase n=1 Tax=Bacillus velezensis TaxID=492670 RepID=UPI0011ACA9EC|nr:CCA tRNA nucleotidyltransferase [Bacillus velezensis]MEC3849988.1 CCA tRNA nucleotidyltransferase [Bacillus velezensis]TWO94301.1 CCA tRNA nucleotidyltransferase [Bacillus velezensis]